LRMNIIKDIQRVDRSGLVRLGHRFVVLGVINIWGETVKMGATKIHDGVKRTRG
jgi:hypothetical protein